MPESKLAEKLGFRVTENGDVVNLAAKFLDAPELRELGSEKYARLALWKLCLELSERVEKEILHSELCEELIDADRAQCAAVLRKAQAEVVAVRNALKSEHALSDRLKTVDHQLRDFAKGIVTRRTWRMTKVHQALKRFQNESVFLKQQLAESRAICKGLAEVIEGKTAFFGDVQRECEENFGKLADPERKDA